MDSKNHGMSKPIPLLRNLTKGYRKDVCNDVREKNGPLTPLFLKKTR